MSRLTDNQKILEILKEKVEEYPDLRFIQLLMNLDVVDHEDRFYEESNITLKRIMDNETL